MLVTAPFLIWSMTKLYRVVSDHRERTLSSAYIGIVMSNVKMETKSV